MQKAIRLAAVLVMASVSAPALAGYGSEGADPEAHAGGASDATATSTSMLQRGGGDDRMRYERGSGRDDPRDPPVRAAPAAPARSDRDAIEEWRHQQFLQEIWAPGP